MKGLLLILFALVIFNTNAQQKQVCITIDDLPAVTNGIPGFEIQEEITMGIVSTLKAYNAKAIGYVNEGKLHKNGELDNRLVGLLEQWLKHEQELGNHTYSHPNYHNVSFKDFSRNIKNGERIIKPLAAKYNSEVRYFRHPYLRIGRSQSHADSLRQFLTANGYTEAPVTIDNDDYLFAAAFTKAYRADDADLMKKISKDYLAYMEEKLIFFEEISMYLYERPIAQTLLIHANLLNSRYLDELLDIYQKHGYAFVSQAEVLEDPAYKQQVTHYGEYGISWIKRWALSDGKEYSIFKDDQEAPAYIRGN